MNKIRIGLAGYGSGGRIYNAPIIKSIPGFAVQKILTSNPENIKFAKNDFPEAMVVSNFESILDDKEIDLVIVLLPNHLHYDFAKKALLAGKHVVVEKPFTPSYKEAVELIKLAGEKELVLSVNHNRRWDSDIRTVKKVSTEGLLGRIVEYEVHFDRFRNNIKDSWKEKPELPGSGILYDLGSHLIDQALTLFGKPKEVFADIRQQRDGAIVPDNFELLLFYPDVKVTLKAGTLVKEKGATHTLLGTQGSFVKYGADVQEAALKRGEIPNNDPNWGQEPEAIWGKLSTLEDEKLIKSEPGDYRIPYQNVYNAIIKNEPLIVTPQQAADVIKVIELAQLSNNERRVVKFE